MSKTEVWKWLLAIMALASSQAAHALSCTVSANATSFGSYSTFSPTALDGVGNVRVSCSNLISILVNYTILLSTGSSGSYSPRHMASGANSLGYNLYTNAARTIVWGNGSAGTSALSDGYLLGVLTVTNNYPVYGRVAAGQNVPPGAYTDTIVVTVNY
jgi:spore coat protein U-like protein